MNRRTRTQVAARQLAKSLAGINTSSGVAYANGVVKTIVVGGSTDAHDQITVTVNGSDTLAPYLDSYTSRVVGDVVRVQTVKGSPLILGRVVGFPSF